MKENVNELISDIECCGCYTCKLACPVNAIRIEPNQEGFDMPIVEETCIHCGACVKKCPVFNFKCENKENPQVYAGWSKDSNVRLDSTSGGIFSELANVIMKSGGYVCGAVYDEKWNVRHIVTNNVNDIYLLRSSKYVQSRIENCFLLIKEKLKLNKVVMIVATPCQIAGLYNYLDKKYENLYTVDFICRGVNSPKVFRKFLDLLEDKYNSKVSYVKFKNKRYGWNRFSTKIKFENGKTYIKDRYTDRFMKGYLEYNCFMRDSCHDCKYNGFPRVADITLADFWGVENYLIDMRSSDGVSMIMTNSVKGERLLKHISNNIYKEQLGLDKFIKGDPTMLESPKKTKNREKFLSRLDNEDFEHLLDSCIPKNSLKKQIKINILNAYYCIRLIIKRRMYNR
ncbi:Coenzyme F420 hydrogenase/dehydrogenase, beta subunit C-terminal domain [Clostridium sp. BL-8]|uniref:Coenzyme F420 hydrogenase/dehydrogenase, beta subunit C-terminal domain n=1 Tax=Clostridium sp. BL-8 TaxID=349938 RepID=UPI00098C35FA|nr:Coenzyme F420 hydrogenase/dehydrogenase, beta subunit C-terminal domain [Clostridium sp. BL-8]OOM79436.1 electron transport complex subunit RsxB [Clostridium sp. BL-8]